jgi:hypothetical protein
MNTVVKYKKQITICDKLALHNESTVKRVKWGSCDRIVIVMERSVMRFVECQMCFPVGFLSIRFIKVVCTYLVIRRVSG